MEIQESVGKMITFQVPYTANTLIFNVSVGV